MQDTQVQSLVQEDPTFYRATEPMHDYWDCALEPESRNLWAHMSQLLKPTHRNACVLQQGKPQQ